MLCIQWVRKEMDTTELTELKCIDNVHLMTLTLYSKNETTKEAGLREREENMNINQ